MTYHILYEKRIRKDLDRIPNANIEKIVNIFKELPHNPFPKGAKKLSGNTSLYRIRQGKYRIIYTVDHLQGQVRIILVAHRREAYRHL